MKFMIIGANRDSGEDVELTIEAQNPEAAQAKARGMGILVAECMAATTRPPQGSAFPSPGMSNLKNRRNLLIAACVVLIAIIIVATLVVPAYREHAKAMEAQREAAERALAQGAEIRAKAQKDAEHWGRVAEEAKAELDAIRKGKARTTPSTKSAAIRNDLLISSLIDRYPELDALIKRGGHRLDTKLTLMVSAGLLRPSTTDYILDFSRQIAALPD